MAVLNYFIPPLSPAMQTRTRIAHVTRGFCLYVTQQHVVGKLPMGVLSLPLTLGLLTSQQGVQFYAPVIADKQELKQQHVSQLLLLASEHWAGSLRDFNSCGCVDLPLRNFTHEQVSEILQDIKHWLDIVRHLPTRKERHTAMKHSETVPQDVMARLDQSLAHLEQALLAKDPMMPQHLRNSHSLLISYPETVHLLEDQEVALLIDAAELHTKTEIVKAVAKGKSSGGSRAKVSVSDL